MVEASSNTAYTYSANVVVGESGLPDLLVLGDRADSLWLVSQTLLVMVNITPDYVGPLSHHQNNSFT